MNIGVVGNVETSGVIIKDDFSLIDLTTCMRVCCAGVSCIMDSSLFSKGSHTFSKSSGVCNTSSMLGGAVQSQDLGEVVVLEHKHVGNSQVASWCRVWEKWCCVAGLFLSMKHEVGLRTTPINVMKTCRHEVSQELLGTKLSSHRVIKLVA